jgi:predicted XRE-type DNA-binding protein
MTVQEMLNRLFQLGLSQTEVAEFCGTTQPTISRAVNGSMVSYKIGKAIESLLSKRERAAKRSDNQAA